MRTPVARAARRSAAALLAVASVPTGLALADLPRLDRERHWVHTVAVVHGGVENAPQRVLTFTVGERVVAVRTPDRLEWLGRRDGEPVGLRYDPADPTRVVFDADDPPWLRAVGVGGTMLAAAGALTFYRRRPAADARPAAQRPAAAAARK